MELTARGRGADRLRARRRQRARERSAESTMVGLVRILVDLGVTLVTRGKPPPRGWRREAQRRGSGDSVLLPSSLPTGDGKFLKKTYVSCCLYRHHLIEFPTRPRRESNPRMARCKLAAFTNLATGPWRYGQDTGGNRTRVSWVLSTRLTTCPPYHFSPEGPSDEKGPLIFKQHYSIHRAVVSSFRPGRGECPANRGCCSHRT